MKASKTFYKIASWAFILVGIGHTITDLTSPKTLAQLEFIDKMKAFPIHIMGTETNIFSFHQGFSLMMGLLFFAYGLMNLFILKNSQQAHLQFNILILNVIISLTAVVLSLKFFFIVPIVFTGIAFLGFAISLILSSKK